MSRMLQDHDGFQPRPDRRRLRRLFHRSLPAYGRQSPAHRRMLVPAETTLNGRKMLSVAGSSSPEGGRADFPSYLSASFSSISENRRSRISLGGPRFDIVVLALKLS
uniref:Putative 40S ribosomal protein S27 n=1 Tax=Spadella cephaloptera TaxID=52888 RepID=A8E6C8_9BILA|nr:TPA: putative 40S ribosomal protein S27 [Spadella cephaloptera]